jgi:hypothetical protein
VYCMTWNVKRTALHHTPGFMQCWGSLAVDEGEATLKCSNEIRREFHEGMTDAVVDKSFPTLIVTHSNRCSIQDMCPMSREVLSQQRASCSNWPHSR